MGKTHHVIYIPGVNDHKSDTQIKLLNGWNSSEIKVHFFHVGWADDEKYDSKLFRLTKLIDELFKQSAKLSLVGVSAGAGLALNAYILRNDVISGIVYICGKLQNPQSISQAYFQNNPAFEKSSFLAATNLKLLSSDDKKKMLTLRALFDGVIPAHDSEISGVKNQVLPMILHVVTIFFAITIYRNRTINFLKHQAGIE